VTCGCCRADWLLTGVLAGGLDGGLAAGWLAAG